MSQFRFFGILVGCAVFLAVLLTACKKEEKLVLATAAEFPPFEFKEGVNFKGIDIEIAQEIAKHLNKELQVQDMEFDSVVGAVSSGNVDFGASGLTINETRSRVVDFSESYFSANQVAIIRNSNEALKNAGGKPETLIEAIKAQEGIKIGVATGYTGAFYARGDADWGFEGFSNAEVKSFVNGSLAVSALENGQVDLVILDEAPARLMVAAYKDLEILDAYLTQEKYGIAVKKGNKELLDSINIVLEKIKNDGTLDKILQKYY